MSNNLYIAATEPMSGKSLVALGLMELLSRKRARLGFFRPVVAHAEGPDNDVQLIAGRYGLRIGVTAVHAFTHDEAQRRMAAGEHEEVIKAILDRYKVVEAECDFVLCEGTDYTGVSSAFEFDFNAAVAKNLGAPILPVISGRGRSADEIHNAIQVAREVFQARGCDVVATIVNRATVQDPDHLARALAGARADGEPLFVIPEDAALSRPSMADVARELDAQLLHGSPESLRREVAHVSVAAMSLAHFLEGLAPGGLVITSGDRTDILLGSFVANRSVATTGLAGIILTGGAAPGLPLGHLIGGLSDDSLPVLAVAADTYETATRVHEVRAWLSADDEAKVARALGLFESRVDVELLETRIDLTRPTRMTPLMFEYELMRRAARDRRRIVLPEGEEERILRAADILAKRGTVDLVLLGDEVLVRRRISALALGLHDVEIIDPARSPRLEAYAAELHRLRRHRGVTRERALDMMRDRNYFGTMMVHMGDVDGMVSGAVTTTAHTIRPAFEFIRTRPGVSVASSVLFMCLRDRVLVYADCAVVPEPTTEQLADIAISSAGTAQVFGIEPRIAMLSYSTGDSGAGAEVERVRAATELVRARRPDLPIEGPIQYDAAVDAAVARTKIPGSEVAGHATVLVFPDLNSGNNAYKAVQRSAGAVVVGPVLQGLNKPVNDLSRGAGVGDIVKTVAITAIQAQELGT
ncbi:MAG TPA: phosphate acetyltransferase [Gammaproteobacteria bacterium]|nr:phosphate acetyltransferase [Gammaproteobacteria bacterium]